MIIRIEVDNKIKQNEVIIRCGEISEEVKNIQIMLRDMLSNKKRITFYKGDTEYYNSLEEILFFDTEKQAKDFIDFMFKTFDLPLLRKYNEGYFFIDILKNIRSLLKKIRR